MKGVQKVDGDAKTKTLTIEFDPQVTSVEAIKKAMKRISDSASKGDDLCGMLMALENDAAPYFLGVDQDDDDSDLAVWP